MRTELIEAFVIFKLHVEVTVRLLVLHEVVDPIVERREHRRPLCARRSVYPFAGIFSRVPRIVVELGEGFVLWNRHIGVAMRLLEPLQVLH